MLNASTCIYHYISVYCVENVSTASTYIALNTLEILTPCVDSVNIHSIEHITLFNTLYQQCQHR